jgi:hypothetical protein
MLAGLRKKKQQLLAGLRLNQLRGKVVATRLDRAGIISPKAGEIGGDTHDALNPF